MILTHGSNSISRGGGVPTEITIGEHTYPVVKIGNRLWTAKGLYEKENESAGAIPIERGSSIKLDKETYGLMYYGVNMFNVLRDIVPNGWRFPNRNDLVDLMSTFPNYVRPDLSANGSSICSTEYWATPGTNETGFGLIPINQNGYITGYYGIVISYQTDPSGYNYELSLASPTDGVITTIYAPGRYFGVRLCRDIP